MTDTVTYHTVRAVLPKSTSPDPPSGGSVAVPTQPVESDYRLTEVVIGQGFSHVLV